MLRPLLALDRSARVPLYRQIERQLREGILGGRFRPGLLLPGVRSLARELGVGKITVLAAYEELAADGYLDRRIGVGTRVAAAPPAPFLRSSAPPGMPGRGSHNSQSASPAAARTIDFRAGHVDVGLLPARLWERLLRDAWRDLAKNPTPLTSDIHDGLGDPGLREAVTTYFSATRGIRCSPEQVVILSSAQAACAIAGRAALRQGDLCALEDPPAPQLRRALALAGPTFVPGTVDEDGMVIGNLPAGGKLALVTPAWQLLLGGRLSEARRGGLLAWAAANSALIVEADLYGHLRYDLDDEAALQADDAAGHVMYVSTFTTMVYPGVRTAFAVVPYPFLGAFRKVLDAAGQAPAAVEQAALARFIDGGHLGRHVVRLRQTYADRQAALLCALRTHLSGLLEASPSPAGVSLVGRIVDDRVSGTKLAMAARALSVEVDPISSFRLLPAGDRDVLLSYAHLAPSEIEAGVVRLALAMKSIESSQRQLAPAPGRLPATARARADARSAPGRTAA